MVVLHSKGIEAVTKGGTLSLNLTIGEGKDVTAVMMFVIALGWPISPWSFAEPRFLCKAAHECGHVGAAMMLCS